MFRKKSPQRPAPTFTLRCWDRAGRHMPLKFEREEEMIRFARGIEMPLGGSNAWFTLHVGHHLNPIRVQPSSIMHYEIPEFFEVDRAFGGITRRVPEEHR